VISTTWRLDFGEGRGGSRRGASSYRHGSVSAQMESDGGREEDKKGAATWRSYNQTSHPKVLGMNQVAITPFHSARLALCHLRVGNAPRAEPPLLQDSHDSGVQPCLVV
jgi:hypothetical protein